MNDEELAKRRTHVMDVLSEIDLELPVDKRPLTEEIRAFMRLREGNHALQELLDRVDDGLSKTGKVHTELNEWRPLVLRLLKAEAVRKELANEAERKRLEGKNSDTQVKLKIVEALKDIFSPRFVVTLLVIIAAAFGIRVSLTPTSVEVTPPPAQVEESFQLPAPELPAQEVDHSP